MIEPMITDVFAKLHESDVVEPFIHKGDWSIHQVIPLLLEETGAARVRIATFNLSEESLRPLFNLTESGTITELTLLIDNAVSRNKLPLMLFAAHITPHIYLDSCHAKLLLIENDRHKFGIMGSANLNTNNRWEDGIYFTGGRIYDYFKTKFDNIIKDAMPYGIE